MALLRFALAACSYGYAKQANKSIDCPIRRGATPRLRYGVTGFAR
jgi:hypothetical protein